MLVDHKRGTKSERLILSKVAGSEVKEVRDKGVTQMEK